jgi:KUP system potassium uptake protein
MDPIPPDRVTSEAKAALCLGALGVVFGDIGTSPLYTMRECVSHLPAGNRSDGILGVLSLIFWSLMLVVSVKYLWYVMKADNQGEGGIFALLALIHSHKNDSRPAGTPTVRRGLGPAVVMILIGAALLYGDGIITPAISVLGAAEGFSAISPSFTPFVPTMACVILAGLFWFQHKGTKSIGGVFGPVMLVWFLAIGLLGFWQLLGCFAR